MLGPAPFKGSIYHLQVMCAVLAMFYRGGLHCSTMHNLGVLKMSKPSITMHSVASCDVLQLVILNHCVHQH